MPDGEEMNFEDKTGTPPSQRDIDEAIQVVKKMIITSVMKLPPELAINLPNILRCLQRLREIEPTFTSTVP
jgi:hypothetical protein